MTVSLEVHKNFKIFLKMGLIPFLLYGGSVGDKKGKKVLSYGDIIRTNDLRVLSKVFKIKNFLEVVRVY